MFCIKADIPKELASIDDECKAIYHSKDSVCFFVFDSREMRNRFVDETQGLNNDARMKIYEKYCLEKENK